MTPQMILASARLGLWANDIANLRQLYPELAFVFDAVEEAQDREKEHDQEIADTETRLEREFEDRIDALEQERDEAVERGIGVEADAEYLCDEVRAYLKGGEFGDPVAIERLRDALERVGG